MQRQYRRPLVEARFGHLDVLVNDAGSFRAGFFEEMGPEAFRSPAPVGVSEGGAVDPLGADLPHPVVLGAAQLEVGGLAVPREHVGAA